MEKVPLGTVGGAIRGVVQRLPAAAKTVELQCRRSFGANGAGPFADMQRFEKNCPEKTAIFSVQTHLVLRAAFCPYSLPRRPQKNCTFAA
jgi:hypothetical protein